MLLGMMCDAVVDLDAECRMKAHEPSLANMLMHGAGKSLRHVSLKDFLAPGEECDAFEAHIQRNCGQDGPRCVGMFSSHLRDSMQNAIRVVFYHVPYLTVGGSVRHLFGIREDTDETERDGGPMQAAEERRPGRRRSRRGTAGRVEFPPAVVADDVASRLEVASAPPPERHSSEGGSSSSGSGQHAASADVLVDDQLPIFHATEGLRSLLGLPVAGGCFSELLLPSDAREFFLWIHGCIKLQRSGVLPSPYSAKFGKLRLRGPGVAVAAPMRVSVCFPAPPQLEHAAHLVSIHVGSGASSGRRGSSRTGLRGTAAVQMAEELPPGAKRLALSL